MSVLTELSPDLKAAEAYINQLTELDLNQTSADYFLALQTLPSVIQAHAAVYENILESGILYDQEFVEHISKYPHGLLSTLRSTLQEIVSDETATYLERKYDGS